MFMETHLDDLAQMIQGEEGQEWKRYLSSIRELHSTMVKKELDEDYQYEDVFENFLSAFETVHEKYDVSETLKIHILNSHVLEYFALTGTTCAQQNDEDGGIIPALTLIISLNVDHFRERTWQSEKPRKKIWSHIQQRAFRREKREKIEKVSSFLQQFEFAF